MKNTLSILFLLATSLHSFVAVGQTVVKISEGSTGSCTGTLTDSDGNTQSPGKYANNEKLVFHLCVAGGGSITLNFRSFCTEVKNDVLKIYKGKDTTGTLIGSYHGSKTVAGSSVPPTTLSISDSCITFYFVSDKNLVCDGWEIDWKAKIVTIPQPKFIPIANPTCNSTKITCSLDRFVFCDSLIPAAFKLTGAKSSPVSKVTPIGCNGNGLTKTFEVEFASPLDLGGAYNLEYNGSFLDACDSLWKIKASLIFNITDCPITVKLSSAAPTICFGTCTQIAALVTGGDSKKYTYTWSPSGNGKGPITVCPNKTTTYKLKVTDGVSVPGEDSITITITNPPVAQNDTTVCRNSANFNLKATPSGGKWSGSGIIDSTNGTFRPPLAGPGTFKIIYAIGQCRDTMSITVKQITAGGTEAACPGSAPFMLSGFAPSGGTWSGENVNPSGLFTPGIGKSYLVTYSNNGCSASKFVNVGEINIPPDDTVCQNIPQDTLVFSPRGGSWSGPGIVHSTQGFFSTASSGTGIKNLIYTIKGCKDTLKRLVKQIDARADIIVCPLQDSFLLQAGLPAGGYWKGEGITDTSLGRFNPKNVTMAGFSKDVVLTYYNDGCKDTKVVYMRQTHFYKDTFAMCYYDTAILLRWATVQNDPWNGMFSGNGVVGTSLYNQRFSPTAAGRGYHKVVYEANTCKDSIIIEVTPRKNIQNDTTLCIADDPFLMFNAEGKGTWSGNGITNPVSGLFKPSVSGAGKHKILYQYPGKCVDTVVVTVNPLPSVSLSLPQSEYCFKDTLYKLNFSPKNGTFSGNGLVDSFFNPSVAGAGIHPIQYKVGSGKCISVATRNAEVLEPLNIQLSGDKDSACKGETIRLTATTSGGKINDYYLNWWNGIVQTKEVFSLVNSTQTTFVNISDGCSEPDSDTLTLYVHPKIQLQFQTSDSMCFGNKGFAKAIPTGNASWKYSWSTGATSDSISAPVSGFYKLKITNNNTGCYIDTFVTIPGYSYVKASFVVIPSSSCLNGANPEIQIIDMSQNGQTGLWDMGDSSSIEYKPFENFTYKYTNLKDEFNIKLKIANEGGCTDSIQTSLCVLDSMILYVPDAFSPGHTTGINDKFMVVGNSIKKYRISIFNIWGELVYTSDDIYDGWDGNHNGKPAPQGYYIYTISYYGRKFGSKHIKGHVYLLR